jgi:DNA anti-recombination protein RmuC
MENFSEENLSSIQDRVGVLEEQLDSLKAYVDQRFDESSDTIDDLAARINNLR